MSVRDDRVLTSTRTLCLGVVPFLVVAFVVLFVFPGDTKEWFAWPIKPRMSAMMLGGVYLGGAYFFVRAARERRWHRIKAGFVPVGVFAGMMGIATIIHWDKFSHGHIAFWLWAGLYFVAPFLAFATWLANRRHGAPVATGDVELPVRARATIGAIGALALVTSAWLFLWPAAAIERWPWTLTPLTSRVLGALFALGIGGLFIAADRRWSAARMMIEVESVMLLLILAAGIRSRADLDFSRPLTVVFVVGFSATLIASVVLFLEMDRRERAGRHR